MSDEHAPLINSYILIMKYFTEGQPRKGEHKKTAGPQGRTDIKIDDHDAKSDTDNRFQYQGDSQTEQSHVRVTHTAKKWS